MRIVRRLLGTVISKPTRIAASDPRVWREIFLQNRSALGDTLAAFRAALVELEDVIATNAGDALERKLKDVKSVSDESWRDLKTSVDRELDQLELAYNVVAGNNRNAR